ncbi:MAG: flagellar biosynthesis anti-sigma factor FlgM [Glaciimonas sp.]|nr:flagellar biosynthesis anti-sigma factor FlgM [Glaciimonas sp.]
MKIDDTVKKNTGLGSNQIVSRSDKNIDTANVTKTPSDSVHLSSQLHALEGQLASSSVFDAKKVEEIKLAITGGHFEVSADKVADGLIKEVSGLLTTGKK